ncbi:hypothetical protein BURMUCGD1_5988 [Burkholderia multivorans CGD1]|nr:hypothetical protein BURMUCGD1_5988 [Burkholderia multivorans CGD1]
MRRAAHALHAGSTHDTQRAAPRTARRRQRGRSRSTIS